ncbi:vanadium-dependent haloperoxidase [Guptibacillus hwajinpoensis]|uniref:Chloroperoxidase n=1 Tax=Guptibacillus hwajinpoensis TaxID=208199 RepID=A0A0J6D1C3_9BACL|nr:vanadium-dependent haloperoxidase [Alkalihalobacillus macyae]KMM39140.1 chloroperoxidase [Alkalihalobacillus macyae]
MSRDNYLKWSEVPYGGETKPPTDPVNPLAGSWPTTFIERRGDRFYSPRGPIHFDIPDPNQIDWEAELKVVQETLNNITPKQIRIAKYWGTGVATKQWTPIIDRLIDTYGATPPYAARILDTVQAGINDTFVTGWYYKYLWDVARPIQYDQELEPILCTPRFPTYLSGHSAIAGCAEVMLSYFFPGEANRLHQLAEEAAVSRLYAGVHFPVDNDAALVMGRQIGGIAVEQLRRQRNASGKRVDTPYFENLHARLRPPPFRQAIPFPFDNTCTSNTRNTQCSASNPTLFIPYKSKKS